MQHNQSSFERKENPALPSRRRCLAGAAAWAAALFSPGAFASHSPQADPSVSDVLWSSRALKDGEKILRACCAHPFVKKLSDGTLSSEAFLYYVVQNVHYLKGYADSMHVLAKRLEMQRVTNKDCFSRAVAKLEQWEKDTDAVRESLSAVYSVHSKGRRIEDDPGYSQAEPAALLYINHEAFHARVSHPAVAMAALLPCFWIYEGLGAVFTSKQSSKKKNPYADWIAGYGSPEYSLEVAAAVAVADDLAREAGSKVFEAMTEAFIASCRMELHLLEAAYRGWRWEALG